MTSSNTDLIGDDFPCEWRQTAEALIRSAKPFLERREASDFLAELGLPCEPQTMAKQAVRGDGCPYRIWGGRAIYSTRDLVDWAEKRLRARFVNSAQRTQAQKRE